jgi:hypothetical protein
MCGGALSHCRDVELERNVASMVTSHLAMSSARVFIFVILTHLGYTFLSVSHQDPG